jgi:hypothetical protein
MRALLLVLFMCLALACGIACWFVSAQLATVLACASIISVVLFLIVYRWSDRDAQL